MNTSNNYKVITILLIILNIVCIYFLMKNNATITYLNDRIHLLTNTNKPLSLVNKRVSPKYISINKVNIIFIFNDNGCKSCITELIDKINRIDNKFDSKIKVFYLGKNPDRISFGRLTKNFITTSFNNLFRDEIEIVQPMGLLVRYDGLVIDSQQEIVGSPSFMQDFIDRALKISEIF
ncbi:MAG: hypothetical protein GYA62_07675 [Bacteroidales bacterium]|nr:hypothetical protein [Bacteroidales bacterium]